LFVSQKYIKKKLFNLVNGKPTKNDILHVRLLPNGDGVVTKEALEEIAKDLSEKEGKTVTASDVVRRALNMHLPIMKKGFTLSDIMLMAITEDKIQKALKEVKLSDLIAHFGTSNGVNLFDVLHYAVKHLHPQFDKYSFNRLLVDLWEKTEMQRQHISKE